jgi:hypothetical protein
MCKKTKAEWQRGMKTNKKLPLVAGDKHCQRIANRPGWKRSRLRQQQRLGLTSSAHKNAGEKALSSIKNVVHAWNVIDIREQHDSQQHAFFSRQQALMCDGGTGNVVNTAMSPLNR